MCERTYRIYNITFCNQCKNLILKSLENGTILLNNYGNCELMGCSHPKGYLGSSTDVLAHFSYNESYFNYKKFKITNDSRRLLIKNIKKSSSLSTARESK